MARSDFNTQGWRSVSKEDPCKACGHTKGCREARDGANICWRVPSSYPRGAGWLHRWDNEQELSSYAPPVVAQAESIASDAFLQLVYRDLLDLCPLSEPHRKHLANDGWTAAEIEQFPCGSLPESRLARKNLVRSLWDRYGSLLAQVPGFIVKEGVRGSWAEILSGGGLLLACLGWDGKIVRLRVRPDSPRGKAKYVWLSSSSQGGPGSGSPPAFFRPNEVESPRRLLITEGEKKAYLATQRLLLQGYPVIGVSLAGVGNHKELLPILERQAREFDEVVIAFDEDEKDETRVRVELHRRHLAQALAERGIPVLLASWKGPKGIDDLLVAKGRFQLEAYAAMAGRATLVNAPEQVKPKTVVATQLELDEVFVDPRKPMTIELARKWMGQELKRRFAEESEGDRVYLLRGRPGVGKTYVLTDFINRLGHQRAYQGKRLVNMTPRHDFADERRQDWNIVTGMEYQAHADAPRPCHQMRYVKRAQELGVGRQEICSRCPLKKDCETNQGRSGDKPFYLEMINSREKRWQVNQNLLGSGRGIWLNSKLGVLTLDDVDLWQVLVQDYDFSWSVLKTALDWTERDEAYAPMQPLLKVLLAAAQTMDLTDLKSELYEKSLIETLLKVSLEHKISLEEVLEQARQAKEPALFLDNQELDEGRWSIPPRLRDVFVRHLERELACYRRSPLEGWNRTFYLNRNGVKVLEAHPLDSPQMKGVPVVVASASMTAEQVTEFFPGREVVVIEPNLEVPTGVRVVQHIDKGYGKTSLLQETDFRRAWGEVEKITRRHAGEVVGCVTHKAAEDRLRVDFPKVNFLHYYGQRGSNALKDSRALITLGTPCPNPEGLKRSAEAFYAADTKIHNYSVLQKHRVTVKAAKGEEVEVSYRVMGDPRLQGWMEARREQELFQAFGRARIYDTEDLKHVQLDIFEDTPELESGKKKRCTVYVFSNLPLERLGIKVDEYVSESAIRLEQHKERTQERIEVLAAAISQLRTEKKKVTQVALAELAKCAVKTVRRLYGAALARLESLREKTLEVRALEPARSRDGWRSGATEQMLKSQVSLPPPASDMVLF